MLNVWKGLEKSVSGQKQIYAVLVQDLHLKLKTLIMSPEVRDFVNSFAAKAFENYTIADLMLLPKKITFEELLKDHNHEIWKACECGNEEDLRKTWKCSECGAVIFKPKIK
jgi:hypothetical protein